MPDPKYDVVFEGRTVEGADPERVRALMRKIFKIGREDAARIFSGRRVVIKRGVVLPEAHRYKNLMRQAGAACRLVPQQAPRPSRPEPPPTPRPAPGKAANRDRAPADVEPAGDGGLGARLKNLDAEDVRRRIGDRFARLGAALDADRVRTGLRSMVRRRRRYILAGALAVVVAVSAAAFWPGGQPMPADAATLETFVADFKAKLLAIETGRSRAVTHVKVAKAAIEDMGYDYDQTLLSWYFDQSLARDDHRRDIRNGYLIGPLKVLFELDAGQLKPLMAAETYATLADTLGIGEHITLPSIEMLRACARGKTLVTHEALVAGLREFGVVVDGDFPEIAVEEAFYGLSHNGLIRITTQREWKTKQVEVEILDPARIADQEKKLRQLESMYAQYGR